MGYALAKRCKTALKFDTRAYGHAKSDRNIELNRIAGGIAIASAEELDQFWPRAGKPLVFVRKNPFLASIIQKIIAPRKICAVVQIDDSFQANILRQQAPRYLSGVWADQRYFYDQSQDIRLLFESAMPTGLQPAPNAGQVRVAVQVRLTDF